MGENYIASIPLIFAPAANEPFRTTAQINVPFRPRTINVIDFAGTTRAVGDTAYACTLWSDLFQKGNSASGYIASMSFPYTNVFTAGSTQPMRLMFSEREAPNIQGSYTFEVRYLLSDAALIYSANFTGIFARLVLEFVR